jgi:hypothetical protein
LQLHKAGKLRFPFGERARLQGKQARNKRENPPSEEESESLIYTFLTAYNLFSPFSALRFDRNSRRKTANQENSRNNSPLRELFNIKPPHCNDS